MVEQDRQRYRFGRLAHLEVMIGMLTGRPRIRFEVLVVVEVVAEGVAVLQMMRIK